MGQFLQKYSDQGKLVLSADGQAQPLMDGRDQVFAAWMLRDQGSGDSLRAVPGEFFQTVDVVKRL